MNINSFKHWMPAGVLLLAIGVTVISWKEHPHQSKNIFIQEDTVPARHKVTREAGDRDLDKELQQLDEARERLDKMKDRDWSKVQAQMDIAMKRVREQQLKVVDMQQLQKEINESLSEHNRQKMLADIERAKLAAFDAVEQKKVRRAVDEAMQRAKESIARQNWDAIAKVDARDINRSMEEVSRRLERSKIDMSEHMERMGEQLKRANEQIDKAQKELEGYQEMIYSMEKEGLLDTKQDYTIEYKAGTLTVNDKKQPDAVVNKYKNYFKKDNTTISKKDGQLQININDGKSYRHFD